MNKEKQIEEMAFTDVDILANELNQHCADLAENYCGGTTCLSCLAHALTEKGYRKASEVAREIFEDIAKINVVSGSFFDFWQNFCEKLAELRKKYIKDGE